MKNTSIVVLIIITVLLTGYLLKINKELSDANNRISELNHKMKIANERIESLEQTLETANENIRNANDQIDEAKNSAWSNYDEMGSTLDGLYEVDEVNE